MSEGEFRETYTLSDAVELLGRRLYAHTWTGLEYRQEKVMSPDELSAIRAPLEKSLADASTELAEIESTILRTVNPSELEQLKLRKNDIQSQFNTLNAKVNFLLPALNDATRAAYESYSRWKTAEDKLVEAIRQRQFIVHDGHGRELNPGVWSHPNFRYYIKYSYVVNGKYSGEPRRQTARIDREPFKMGLTMFEPLVKSLQEPSPEQRLCEFIQRQVAESKISTKKTKSEYRALAKDELGQIPKAMFERVWSEQVPDAWHKPGAPKGSHSSRHR